jgi:fimbrial chaperone protein
VFRKFAVILCLLTLSSCALLAHALEIAPTTVMLPRDRPVGMMRLANNSSAPATYELTVHGWSQEDGEDVLSPEPGLVVTPPVVSLDPNAESIVRIGLLTPSGSDGSERTYRLLIRDISPVDHSSSTGLRIRMEYLIPVFLPAQTPHPGIQVMATRVSSGALCVVLKNSGNTHQKLVGLQCLDTPAKSVSLQKYVLAASEAEVCTDQMPDISSDRISASLAPTYAMKAQNLTLPAPAPHAPTVPVE